MMCSVLRLLSFSNQTLVIDGCVVLYACLKQLCVEFCMFVRLNP